MFCHSHTKRGTERVNREYHYKQCRQTDRQAKQPLEYEIAEMIEYEIWMND